MGCGSRVIENNTVLKLLDKENTEFTSLKETEICPWSFNISFNNNNNNAGIPSKLPNKKSKQNGTSRHIFGYKSNNKVNTFNFQNHSSINDYIIQYRNENKSVKCFTENYDFNNSHELFTKPTKNIVDSIVADIIYPMKTSSDSAEKSLIHQVKFWQNQNSEFDKYRQTPADVIDNQKPVIIGPQITGSFPSSNFQSGFGQRSSFHNKRNLDMIIPQGSTYDILSDDNRLSGANVEIDKLNIGIKNRTHSFDGFGFFNMPYQINRESSKVKVSSKEGGSLEFAKLLDEKLRILYEKRNAYQSPVVEVCRFKPENKPKPKPAPRQKSATYQIPNDYLNNLSISGKSAGAVGKNTIISVPKTAEEQWSSSIPCLLPQMPAFGTQNFPRFVNSSVNFCSSSNYFNYNNINVAGSNNNYRRNSEHDE